MKINAVQLWSCFIMSVFLFNCSVKAQSDSISMSGLLSIHKSSSFKYRITVGLREGKWYGYSLLDEGGVQETKTSITALFSKQKKAFVFSEKLLIATRSKEQSFCFIHAALQMNEKKAYIKGFFVGQDEKKQMCGSGTIRLNLPEKAKILMTPDGSPDTNISAIVTSKKSEAFEVKNGKVLLEVWDGGITDKDSITVSLNGQEVQAPFQISAEKKTIALVLKKGENIIKIKALNEGEQAPNSARFLLIDINLSYPVVSFLRKGEEATVTINW